MCRVIPGTQRYVRRPLVGWKVFAVTKHGFLMPLYIQRGRLRKRAGKTYTSGVGPGFNIFRSKREALEYAKHVGINRRVRVYKVRYSGRVQDAAMFEYSIFSKSFTRVVAATTMTIKEFVDVPRAWLLDGQG